MGPGSLLGAVRGRVEEGAGAFFAASPPPATRAYAAPARRGAASTPVRGGGDVPGPMSGVATRRLWFDAVSAEKAGEAWGETRWRGNRRRHRRQERRRGRRRRAQAKVREAAPARAR